MPCNVNAACVRVRRRRGLTPSPLRRTPLDLDHGFTYFPCNPIPCSISVVDVNNNTPPPLTYGLRRRCPPPSEQAGGVCDGSLDAVAGSAGRVVLSGRVDVVIVAVARRPPSVVIAVRPTKTVCVCERILRVWPVVRCVFSVVVKNCTREKPSALVRPLRLTARHSKPVTRYRTVRLYERSTSRPPDRPSTDPVARPSECCRIFPPPRVRIVVILSVHVHCRLLSTNVACYIIVHRSSDNRNVCAAYSTCVREHV